MSRMQNKEEKNLAVPMPANLRQDRKDIKHHTTEWSSGSRGGGSVPKDFGWHTNPKQNQEENGSSDSTTKK